jgi:hypothetical protein
LPSLCPCRTNHSERGPVASAPSTSRSSMRPSDDSITSLDYPSGAAVMP